MWSLSVILVYLVEVNCLCPPVVGETCNLTCFSLLGVHCQAYWSSSHLCLNDDGYLHCHSTLA